MKRVLSLLLVLMLLGCQAPPVTPTAPALRGNLTFAGSTTVQPLVAKIGEAFNELYPDVTLDIAAGGSSVGIQAIHDGIVDVGMTSRALTPVEAEGITRYQIAVDVLAIIVNEVNSVETLTLDQLRAIYLGQITNWRDVGGPDAPITVVVRGLNSGTRGAFDEMVLDKAEPAAPLMQAAVTAGDMSALVTTEPYAIGYVGFGNLDDGLKVVAIDGVLPTEANAQNGVYGLVRPLCLLTGPLTQPVAREFIDFALSPAGQAVVAENGWVPVP
ncbi:MAG: phosphate ABC transporter substrate-binding protein [Anaerolineae bacterium]|nr:phosphate ABC transporter substrate-binding protein [Anaerolineae bacterium]